MDLKQIINGEGGNYLAPFLWLHNEDDARIVRELERIRDCGIGAVCIESRTHEEFCREDWWSDVRLILDTCKRLGMKLWILDDKHFPSGWANGIFQTKYPHLRAKNITERHLDVCGPVKEGSVLLDEWKSTPEDEILAVLAMRRLPGDQVYTGEIFDLSDGITGGRCYFDLPDGIFTVVILLRSQADMKARYRMFGDVLNPAATDAYIEEVYEAHYARFADEFGKTLLGFFSDEPGLKNNTEEAFCTPMGQRLAGYPWNRYVADSLRKLWGEDLYPMLCRIWFDFADGSAAQARVAYMDVITRAYRDNFCGRIGRWCEEHGVMYIGHIIEDNGAHKATGVAAGHYFRSLEGQHMSGVDVVLHQILPGLTDVSNAGSVSYRQMDNKMFHYVLGKMASSAAHTEARKQGRAMCEIFGAYGWAEGTRIMKYLADHFLVRGVNYYVPHAFSPKENDRDCPPNFYNSGKNPQFKYFRLLMDYMNRMCAMTENMIHVPSAAILYDAEAEWSGTPFTDNSEIAKRLYDAGLDYDIIPFDRLDDMDAHGCICGETYPVILMPSSAHITEENRARLLRHKDRVTVTGDAASDGFPFVPLAELVSYMEAYRQITFSSHEPFLRAALYQDGERKRVFLANENISRTVSTEITLRGFAGGEYVLYDAFTNKAVRRCSQDGRIPVTLAPYNVLVLLTGEDPHAEDVPLITENSVGSAVCPPLTWEISLCTEQKMPQFIHWRTTDTLVSVTGRDALPDFTGNMRYRTTLSLRRSSRVLIDLGDVGETAQLFCNGNLVGIRLVPPYRFDVTEYVRDGENELEVLVANTCTFAQRDRFSRYLLSPPSGLLGPVTVRYESSPHS